MGEWLGEHPATAMGLAAGAAALVALGAVALLLSIGRRLRQRPLLWLPFLATIPVCLLAGAVATVLGLQAAALFPIQREFAPLADRPAPDIRFLDLETGEPRSLAAHRGRVVLVNRWATWCAPCREEIPELERLYADYRARGLVVLLLSDEPPETQRAFFEGSRATVERGYADDFPGLPCPAYPTTYVIDREGVIRHAFLGARPYRAFARAVEPYL